MIRPPRGVSGPLLIYVDDDAPLGGNGTSWATAFRYLQDALAMAVSSDEIRVAGGVYKPDLDETGNVLVGDRAASFWLVHGVSVYGGYAGLSQPGNPDQRDTVTFETVLSGDLQGNDGPDFANNGDNSYHVVIASGVARGTLLDGVTVTAGNASGDRRGGGISIEGDMDIQNCTFSANTAEHAAGAMQIWGASQDVRVANCSFFGNTVAGASSGFGGALESLATLLRIDGGTFQGNDSIIYGGAMHVQGKAVIEGTSFVDNEASLGGAVNVSGAGTIVIDGATFTGNRTVIDSTSSAAGTGGAVRVVASSTAQIIDCMFEDNTAQLGGAVYGNHDGTIIRIVGTTFQTNTAVYSSEAAGVGSVSGDGGAIRIRGGADAVIIDSIFEGNSALYGGAIRGIDAGCELHVQGSTFRSNQGLFDATAGFGGWGGASFTDYDFEAFFTECLFEQNYADNDGGALSNARATLTVLNSAFYSNSGGDDGGALRNFEGNLEVVGSWFSGNTCADYGAGMYDGSDGTVSVISIRNSTFSGNHAGTRGGATSIAGGTPLTLENCILWNNTASVSDPQIFGATTIATYSCVEGGWPGTGNISTDPLFVDPDGVDNTVGTDDDDLRLQSGSGCIDAGDNDAVIQCGVDYDDNARRADDPATADTGNSGAVGTPIVDIGAFEFGAPALSDCGFNALDDACEIAQGLALDCDSNSVPDACYPDCDVDGVPDTCELTGCTPGDVSCADCNANGVPDGCDVADGVSYDCNANGIPDECEPDCNANGIPNDCETDCNCNNVDDAADIARGTSQDCNGTGVPDECELTEDDCNANGIPDECDISECASSPACDDCNNNGVPDECDIGTGGSVDTDGNGVPDECDVWDDGAGDNNWNTAGNWLDNTVPVPGDYVVIDGSIAAGATVDLNVAASVARLRMRNNATLNVTGSAGENLVVTDTGGIVMSGTEDGSPKAQLQVDHDRTIDVVSGPFLLSQTAVYQAVSGSTDVAAVLNAASVEVREGYPPGEMILKDSMSVTTTGDFTLRYRPEGHSWQDTVPCGPNTLALARGGAIDRPRVKATDLSSLVIGGDFHLQRAASVSFGAGTTLYIAGSFINEVTECPDEVDLSEATVIIGSGGTLRQPIGGSGGGAVHLYEIAGKDLGSVDAGFAGGFAVGRLVVAPGATVAFVDQFDNDGSSDPEALYVNRLELGAGAIVSIDDSKIFYREFANQGASVTVLGAGSLTPMPVEVVGSGGRYLQIRTSTTGGTQTEDVIRVKFIALDGFALPDPDYMFVGPAIQAPEEDSSQAGLTFTAASLQCDPFFHDWSSEGVIAVFGAEIVPSSEYVVQRADALCPDLADEGCWSAPVTITTAKFGDVAPLFDNPGNPPQPDFGDIAAVVEKFLASEGAPLKAMAQLQPNRPFPDRAISFKDIAADVCAFLGTPYSECVPDATLCPCPSGVTCNATSCVNDNDCSGGYCIELVCTDACGRCAP